MSHFNLAVVAVDCYSNNGNSYNNNNNNNNGNSCVRMSKEIYSNYATALRKNNQLDDSLKWYTRCLSLSPSDPNTHASIAFTLHLMKQFDSAITSYHRALALQPTFTFCIDMLSKAMGDSCNSMSMSGTDFENRTFSSNSFHFPNSSVDGPKGEDTDSVSFMLGETDSLSFLRTL